MGKWTAKLASAFHRAEDAARRATRRKVRTTPFDEKNGKLPLNASGVVQVGPGRFVFIDNHDPSSLFELALDGKGAESERIQRRLLSSIGEGQLRDPEAITRIEIRGETYFVVASSLCVADASRTLRFSDGLVRVRYTPHGDLQAEPMTGFRDWLLSQDPSLGPFAGLEPDAGGLNLEGLVWDPHADALLFGQRGPAELGLVTLIRVPVDVDGDPWTTGSLGTPTVLRIRTPNSALRQGIRDISYDQDSGQFVLLIGRSTSKGDIPFQLCAWDGRSTEVRLLDVTFHRSMKPEGVVAFSSDTGRHLLIVDDNGGYAVIENPIPPDDQPGPPRSTAAGEAKAAP